MTEAALALGLGLAAGLALSLWRTRYGPRCPRCGQRAEPGGYLTPWVCPGCGWRGIPDN